MMPWESQELPSHVVDLKVKSSNKLERVWRTSCMSWWFWVVLYTIMSSSSVFIGWARGPWPYHPTTTTPSILKKTRKIALSVLNSQWLYLRLSITGDQGAPCVICMDNEAIKHQWSCFIMANFSLLWGLEFINTSRTDTCELSFSAMAGPKTYFGPNLNKQPLNIACSKLVPHYIINVHQFLFSSKYRSQ